MGSRRLRDNSQHFAQSTQAFLLECRRDQPYYVERGEIANGSSAARHEQIIVRREGVRVRDKPYRTGLRPSGTGLLLRRHG